MDPLPPIDLPILRLIADESSEALNASGLNAFDPGRYDDYFVGIVVNFLGVDTGPGIHERAQVHAWSITNHLKSIEATQRRAPLELQT